MDVPPSPSTPAPSAAADRPLKVGVILPVEEGELASVTARWLDFADIARVAEIGRGRSSGRRDSGLLHGSSC